MPSRGYPEVQEFSNVQRIANAVAKCLARLWRLENITTINDNDLDN